MPADHEVLWLLPTVAFARWARIPAAGEAELLRIAVDPAHRGQSLGRILLEACQRDLETEGMSHLYLEVRAPTQRPSGSTGPAAGSAAAFGPPIIRTGRMRSSFITSLEVRGQRPGPHSLN